MNSAVSRRLAFFTLAALALPPFALAQQSTAGYLGGCEESDSCPQRPSQALTSRSNPLANTFNEIQQNLQQEDQAIQNATNQILNAVQQQQDNDSSDADSDSSSSDTYNSDDSSNYQGSTSDADASPSPDPAEIRNEAAGELLSDANTLVDSSDVPATPASAGNPEDTGVASDVSNVLGDASANSGVAQDVSDVLGDNNANSSVASDVSSALGANNAAVSPPTEETETVETFSAGESDLSAESQPSPATSTEEIQDADTEIMETSSSQPAESSDEVTQQTENSLPPDEDSPSLGGWLQDHLNYVQTALGFAQQKMGDAVADSTSDDPVTQKVNEIYNAANPLTGLGPAIAAAGGNVPQGLYNYLDTLVNKTGQLFGLIVNPDASQ